MVITVTDQAHLTYELNFIADAEGFPPIEADLVPISANVWAGTGAGPSFSEGWMPVVSTTVDGVDYCYVGMRATPKVSSGSWGPRRPKREQGQRATPR